jgi:starch synthase (maltosyl-transferring)
MPPVGYWVSMPSSRPAASARPAATERPSSTATPPIAATSPAVPVAAVPHAKPAGGTSRPPARASSTDVVAEPTTGPRSLYRHVPPTVGRIVITDVTPVVDAGRRPARAVPGQDVPVSAVVIREGHDALGANVVLYDPAGRPFGRWTPLAPVGLGTDRYAGSVRPGYEGDWTFRVEAWSDPVGTWLHAAHAKVDANSDDSERTLLEGAALLERVASELLQVPPREVTSAADELTVAAEVLRDATLAPAARMESALTHAVLATLRRYPVRDLVTESEPFPLRVDRKRALAGSWYEFFPRSEGAVVDPAGELPPRSGTLRTAARRLAGVAAMGFDVVYLPPIHPIGETFRKGPNNTLTPGPYDVGSPWAIGGPLGDGTMGGHDAVHPDLGTIEDFDAFVAEAHRLGMEVALDFALQCSPDHPWVTDHPEWFRHRIDGSIAYAENPPKKYQDIYPIDFDTDPEGILTESLRVLRYWMAHGVRIFRVDNPHTKPVSFWERLIDDIAQTDPDVLFLAEAFTRPAMLHALARIGFHQSYTYITWRNSKDELVSYGDELAHGPASAYLRPNLFVNTPDILPGYLQHGGREAFCVRAVLAATMGPTWGVYAGFELCENAPLREGGEEYLDSEKYQLRPRDWAGAEAAGQSIAPLLRLLNQFRRDHPALGQLHNLRFHSTGDDAVLCYSKRVIRADTDAMPAAGTTAVTSGGGPDGTSPDDPADVVLVVVNLDPFNVRETIVSVDPAALFPDEVDGPPESFEVCDEFTGARYRWGRDNYVRLDPRHNIAHLFVVRRVRD